MDLNSRRERKKYTLTTRIERTKAARRSLRTRVAIGLLVVAFLVVLPYVAEDYGLMVAIGAAALLGLALIIYVTVLGVERWRKGAFNKIAADGETTPPEPLTQLEPTAEVNSTQAYAPVFRMAALEAVAEPKIDKTVKQQEQPLKSPAAVVKPIETVRSAVVAQEIPEEGEKKHGVELSFFKRLFSRPVLGIDVGNSQIKIVELQQGNPPNILRYSIVPTPRGSVENGLIRRPDELSVALDEAIQMGKFTTHKAATTLTGQNLMLREMKLPPMPKKEMRAAINWQIDQLLQLSKEDTLTDFTIMPGKKGEATSVMLVAMQKEPIVKFLDYMRGKGFNVSRVDIEPLSVYRTVLLASRDAISQGTHLICDFGAGTTNISIFKGGVLQAARVISMGGNQLTRAVMTQLNVDFVDAENQKILHGLQPDSPIYSSLLPVRDRLFVEISTTVNYYLSKNKGESIDSVQLVGGNSILPDMAPQLEIHLRETLSSVATNFKLQVANPLEHMVHNVPKAELALAGATLSVAIGLALGEV